MPRDNFGAPDTMPPTISPRNTFGASDASMPPTISPMEQRVVAIENEILRLIRTIATLQEMITAERVDRRKADLNRQVFSIGDEPYIGHTDIAQPTRP